MNSFLYLYKRAFINRMKKALRKVSTYILFVVIIAYVGFLLWSFGMMAADFSFNTPDRLAVLLSFLVIYLMPANLVSYSKRKGLIFKPADTNFVFQAPNSPKAILLYAHFKSIVLSALLGLVLVIAGIVIFNIHPVIMLIYFLFTTVLENILEGSMMILCYGNERFEKKTMDKFVWVLYAFMAVFAIICVLTFYKNGVSFATFENFLANPVIQCIPIVGWNIAVIRLLFVGPTMLNMICAGLFVVATVLMFFAARRMKCTGAYFEDAAKFADDYAEARKKSQKGETVFGTIGKRRKFKQAEITYKGTYGKAIYYRQLLEYKKTRFFIFDKNTLIALIVGVGIAVFAWKNNFAQEMGDMKIFIIPGVMAYVLFIFSGYMTKWAKELENPYTYLIPDSSMKKMWYATKIEHIRSLIDGCLMVIPGGIVMNLTIFQIILTILVYLCLTANRLYLTMLADVIIGNRLGQFGRSLVKLFFQAIVIGVAIIVAVIAGIVAGFEAAFIAMIFVTAGLTAAGAVIAATSFERMETTD